MFNTNLAIRSLGFVLSGLQYTLGIAVVSFLCGTVLGFGLVLMKRSNWRLLRGLAAFHVSFMRGTPTLVFLFLLYFGLPYLKIQLPAVVCAILCFSISSSAYICEVLRASMDAIDDGQWQAATSLGLPYRTTLRRVILPQAFRISLPPLSNVLLDMIKGTSLAAMITVPDMFQNAKIVGGRELDYMTMYILVALLYWVICLLFEQGQRLLEHRLSLY